MKREKAKSHGFTLIELMVVILVICLLAGFLFRLVGNMDTNDKIANTKARLQKIAMALECYKSIYGKYPPVPYYGGSKASKAVNQPNGGQPIAFECPSMTFTPLSGLTFDKGKARNIAQEDARTDDGIKWSECGIYTFGLVSFFVPRYTVAMSQNSLNGDLNPLFGQDKDTETWGNASPVKQWKNYNKRRSDSAIGDSTRDINASRKILPYLDGGINEDGSVNLGIIQVINQDRVSQRTLTYGGGSTIVPVAIFRLVDAWADDGPDSNEDSPHQLRYISRPPYETFEIRSSGPNGVWDDYDDIVVGGK